MEFDAKKEFTLILNDLFDAMNRRFKKGVTCQSSDFAIIIYVQKWLDEWEHELVNNAIVKAMFLTKSMSEGLRVTLQSTKDMCTFLTQSCNFGYVLTGKFNQDPIERFFGKIRQAGCQNDHPTMPTFLQLYKTLSLHSLLKPPMFGNCAVVEGEKPALDVSNFRSLFRSGSQKDNIDFVTEVKKRLDKFILQEEWECEDVASTLKSSVPEVSDCIVYYLSGFLSRKMTKMTSCDSCLAAFTVTRSDSAEAALTNCKSRGELVHPNIHFHRILKSAEEFFSKNADRQDVYWGTIDYVLETCALSFPCGEQKGDVISQILHFYVSMRMRQHCKRVSSSLKKEAQKKKKQTRLCAS